ncbi:MAG: hypothetical protein LBS51_04905 [Oscillospiraceae bacterium]|jgi:hypothetical protein|nr:hypothetical protein [Oscillospiraceae bacterium]
MKKQFIFNRLIRKIAATILVIAACTAFTIPNSSANWYAGMYKPDFTYTGISAYIMTPSSFPTLSSGGESTWVSNYTSDGYWVQTGIRYYPGYAQFKAYVEHNLPSGYGIDEYGIHGLNVTIPYRVQFEPSTTTGYKWYAYINGTNMGGYALTQYANVQAASEIHVSGTQMGPFEYSSVSTRDSGTSWVSNNTPPFADSPYHVTIQGNYASYTTYGP